MKENEISEAVIGAAIDVHRSLGPGLLESVYEECLAVELGLRGLTFSRQCVVPLIYKGVETRHPLRIDLLVEDRVVVELKSVERLAPIHTAQLLTYLRLLDRRLGLLVNFNVPRLVDGVRRVANELVERT